MTRRRLPLPWSAAPPERRDGVSRRAFLTGSGATAVVALVATGCTDDDRPDALPGSSSTPTTAAERARTFFTPLEARLVEAATARILPGTPEDPGAREAEVVIYIDALLASGGWGGEPVYRMPPFVTPGEDDDSDSAGGSGSAPAVGGGASSEDEGEIDTTSYGVTRRPHGTFDRYGEQSMLAPPEVYRMALPALDAHALARFGVGFLAATEDQQDEVLTDVEEDRAPTFGPAPSGRDFFALLRQHTIEGMFSDPIYGGNRDLVGWRLVGFPGAQRAYSEAELRTPAPPRPPQGIADLPSHHGGRDEGRTPVEPLAGREPPSTHRHGAG